MSDLKRNSHRTPRLSMPKSRCVTPALWMRTHLVFAGNRAAELEQRIAGATYQQIAAAGGGILCTVALTRAATEERVARIGAQASQLDDPSQARRPSRPSPAMGWTMRLS